MSAGDTTPMEAEFDTVAAWTEQAIDELGRPYALPAACRGSGSPAELAWLAHGLALGGEDRFVDVGSGLGGPSAWLVDHLEGRWGGRPLMVEPMHHAAAAARRLFGLSGVTAWSQHLPLSDGTMDAAWALGVLCTTSDKRDVLAELRRVLVPGGRLGLLVLTAEQEPAAAPDGNDFPTRASLRADLEATGFRVDAAVDGRTLDPPPTPWVTRATAVGEVVRTEHGDSPQWRQAQDQERTMSRLMEDGQVVTVLVRATAV